MREGVGGGGECLYQLLVDFGFYLAGWDEAVGCGERSEPHRSRWMRFVPHRILRRYPFQQNLSRTGITYGPGLALAWPATLAESCIESKIEWFGFSRREAARFSAGEPGAKRGGFTW